MTALLPTGNDTVTPLLSPFRVDRVAGLSATSLDLDATSVDLLFAELDQVDREVQAMAGAVSDVLYQLVPELDDDVATRRVVLATRRCCGGGSTRFPARDTAAVVSGAITERLDAEAARLFDTWYDARERRERLLVDLEDAYAGDVERSQESLRQVLAHEDFATGVAQANPIMGQSMDKLDLRPGKRDARSLGGYLSRAARKTSPFSLLTGVSSTADREGPVRELLTVSQSHVVAWLDALAAQEELIGAFELEPLWTPGRNPITDSIVMPEVTKSGGYTWRQDRSLHLAEWGEVLGRLQYLGRRPAAVYLSAVGGVDAFATVRRLIDVGVLRVVAPWGYGESDRLAALVQALRTHDSATAGEVADLLADLADRVQALAGATGQARARDLVAVQQHAEQLIAGYGVPAAAAGFTVYSDARSALRVGELGGHVEADLAALGRAVRPLMFRSHTYDELLGRFTARYGVGGTCPDLFGFLSTVGDDGDGLQGMFKAAAQDAASRGRPGERAWLPVGASSAPPSTAVLYQVAGSDLAAVREGDFRLVVNQMHAGTGSLVSRFHGLDGGGLRESLRDWATQLYPGARVVEFIASSGVNDMQSACEGTFPRLRWPTELPVATDPEGSLDLTDVRLRHNAVDDVLEFSTATGQIIAPLYMGLVPAHLLAGAERVLSVLADPWVNGAAAVLRALPPVAEPDTPGTAARPRTQHGRIVTKRASWTLRVDELPRPDRHESEAGYLRRLNLWRRDQGIPEHAFVRNHGGSQLDSGLRKPYWVSFLSPHAVAQLLAVTDKDLQALTFVEVLPGDADLWLADPSGNPYVAEHLTHLRWDRPEASDEPNRAATTDGPDQPTVPND